MKQRSMIAISLIGVGLLSAVLSGCQSQQTSDSGKSQAELKAFKGSAPPANMAQEIQQAQQNWQKHHPESTANVPGIPGAPGAVGH